MKRGITALAAAVAVALSLTACSAAPIASSAPSSSANEANKSLQASDVMASDAASAPSASEGAASEAAEPNGPVSGESPEEASGDSAQVPSASSPAAEDQSDEAAASESAESAEAPSAESAPADGEGAADVDGDAAKESDAPSGEAEGDEQPDDSEQAEAAEQVEGAEQAEAAEQAEEAVEAPQAAPAAPVNIVEDYRASFDHGPKGAEYQKYIVLHDTESDGPASGIIDYWDGNGNLVAAHFVIDKDGTIWQCVPLDRIAHHAGYGDAGHNEAYAIVEDGRDDMAGSTPIGDWAPDYGMNAWSVGIEMVHVGGSGYYPEEQLQALDNLIAYIDGSFGFQSTIIDHKAWRSGNSDTSPEFAEYLANYQDHRTHL